MIVFMTPPYIASMGWILFMQKKGLFQQLFPATGSWSEGFFCFGGLVLVMSLHVFPFLMTMPKNAMLNIPASLEESGAVLGAGFGLRLRKIFAPLLTGNYSLSFQGILRKAGDPILTNRNEVTIMTYKTIVIDYAPKAKKMAAAIEQTANERAQDGWELVTFSVTNSAKAILVFRVPDEVQQEEPLQEETVPQEDTAEAVGDAE